MDEFDRERLQQVEKHLKRLRQQIAGKENARIAAHPDDKERIQLGIDDLREEMKPLEEEYWQLVARLAPGLPIDEPEAEQAIAEVVEAVAVLETGFQDDRSPEMLQLLRQIRDKLNEPGKPAAAKLTGTLSLLPPFVNLTYKAELDTETFLRKHLPTFSRLIPAALKK